jgi:hypothetical protein
VISGDLRNGKVIAGDLREGKVRWVTPGRKVISGDLTQNLGNL